MISDSDFEAAVAEQMNMKTFIDEMLADNFKANMISASLRGLDEVSQVEMMHRFYVEWLKLKCDNEALALFGEFPLKKFIYEPN